MVPCPAAWRAQGNSRSRQAPSRAPLEIEPPMAQEKPAPTYRDLLQPKQKRKRRRPVLLGNVGPGRRELRGVPGQIHFSHLNSSCVLGRVPGAHPAVFLLKLRLDLRDVLQSPAHTVESFLPHS